MVLLNNSPDTLICRCPKRPSFHFHRIQSMTRVGSMTVCAHVQSVRHLPNQRARNSGWRDRRMGSGAMGGNRYMRRCLCEYFKYDLYEFKFREKFMLPWSSLPLAAACFAQWTFAQWIGPNATTVCGCSSIGVLFSSSNSSRGSLHARKACLL